MSSIRFKEEEEEGISEGMPSPPRRDPFPKGIPSGWGGVLSEGILWIGQRLWSIFNYWIEIAYQSDDQSEGTQLGIDETSVRKGHDYVTVAAILDIWFVRFFSYEKNPPLTDSLTCAATMPGRGRSGGISQKNLILKFSKTVIK